MEHITLMQNSNRYPNLLGAPQSTHTSFPSIFLIDCISWPLAEELLLPLDWKKTKPWFVTVIMSSSRALCCLSSVKKQKRNFHLFLRSMCNKTIIRFGFCDTHNNHKNPIQYFFYERDMGTT